VIIKRTIPKSPTDAPVAILLNYHDNQLVDRVIEVQGDSGALAPTKTIRMKPKDDSSFSF